MTTAPHAAPQADDEPGAAASAAAAPEPAGAEGRDARDEQIVRLTEEAAKYRDQWVRAAAEAENIRKRAQRELEENARYAVTGFARDMVEVLENLSRASSSIPAEKREGSDLLKTLGEGVDLTLQELVNIFQRYGIRRIDPQGQKFDHNVHQAVVQVERADVPAGTVVQVVQAGYLIHDRLLRPAMVVVSRAPAPDENPGDTLDTTA